MEEFIDQLEVLKRIYTELPENDLPEALDVMDQYLEQMGRSVVFVTEEQEECLVDCGQTEVNDYLEGSSTSSPSMPHYSPEFTGGGMISEPRTPILYCFTCGDSFNNRKSLYRHGKSTNHKTREQNFLRKPAPKPLPEFTKPAPMELSEILSLIENGNDEEEEGDRNKKEDKFICYECKREFCNRKALYRHGQRSDHRVRLRRAYPTKGGPISCSKCSFRTANNSNLKRHLQRAHLSPQKTPEFGSGD